IGRVALHKNRTLFFYGHQRSADADLVEKRLRIKCVLIYHTRFLTLSIGAAERTGALEPSTFPPVIHMHFGAEGITQGPGGASVLGNVTLLSRVSQQLTTCLISLI